MNRYNLTLAVAVCCAICLHLLGGKTPLETARAPELIVVAANPTEGVPSVTEQADAQLDDQLSDAETATEQKADIVPVKIAFAPPFPDRTTLFQAPKRQGRGGSGATGQSEASVELLGFVNVNGPRVALAINGLVTTVAEGEQEYGIEVISIQPPAVVLQRGRQRWQASFEN